MVGQDLVMVRSFVILVQKKETRRLENVWKTIYILSRNDNHLSVYMLKLKLKRTFL